ncbi:unnamed protein product, partial [Clonostachys chloroleuca]
NLVGPFVDLVQPRQRLLLVLLSSATLTYIPEAYRRSKMPEISFYDPSVDQVKLERYPYIDITFGDGGLFTYRCYSDSEKKIG